MTTTAPVALDNTMGTLFIGIVLAMALWGAGCVQVYYYFNRYKDDSAWIKLLVFIVWALDTMHQGLITHTAYTYLVTEYGNLVFLGTIVKSLLIEVIVSGLVVLFVQSFFVLRVWKLSHGNYYLITILVALVLAEFGVTLAYTVVALKLDTFARLAGIVNLSRAVNIFGVAGDVAIAASLIFLLQQSRTGFRRSDSIINRLILFSLNTGLLTSLDAVMSLITITVLPNTFIYIMFFVTVSRLYTNSLLATLNSRKSLTGNGLGDDTTGSNSVSVSGTMGRFRTNGRAVEIDGGAGAASIALKSQAYGANTHTVSIKVNTETETVRDIEAGTPHKLFLATPPTSNGSSNNNGLFYPPPPSNNSHVSGTDTDATAVSPMLDSPRSTYPYLPNRASTSFMNMNA